MAVEEKDASRPEPTAINTARSLNDIISLYGDVAEEIDQTTSLTDNVNASCCRDYQRTTWRSYTAAGGSKYIYSVRLGTCGK